MSAYLRKVRRRPIPDRGRGLTHMSTEHESPSHCGPAPPRREGRTRARAKRLTQFLTAQRVTKGPPSPVSVPVRTSVHVRRGVRECSRRLDGHDDEKSSLPPVG